MGQGECNKSNDLGRRSGADNGGHIGYYVTVNYLFATYLQTEEGGSHKIKKIEKIRPGRAKFYFEITEDQATDLKFKFHNSACSEFERMRKHTIDLSY